MPGVPSGCRGLLRERGRWTWRLGDGGDPAALLDAALTAYGLGAAAATVPGAPHPTRPGTTCGAALLVSAAASAAMIGGATGAPTPAPAVPDIALVAYEHRAPDGRPTRPPRPSTYTLGPWRPSWSTEDHAGAVRAVRAAIGRGDVYQTNVVGHARAAYAGDPSAALARIAAMPEARYAGGLAGPDWAIACASPERLVTVVGDTVTTGPIKGTRPATEAGRADLLASVKERAEHVMIVDLERNDLAHVAVPGSIAVGELFVLRRWRDLWQAESTISARLRPGTTLLELLRAVCPGGSVTGTPKLAALDAIAALEPVGRGPAMGALGYVTEGRLDLGLTIRTAAADASHLHLWAGGGITWRSDPDEEVAEAAAKAAPVRALLQPR